MYCYTLHNAIKNNELMHAVEVFNDDVDIEDMATIEK